MVLKSINEHNAQRRLEIARALASGVACPDCGGELMYVGSMLLTHPPKRKVKCEDCDFTDMVIA